MLDIAKLGFKVDSSGAVVASNRLDKMTSASKKAETATEKLVRQTEKMSKAAEKMGRNMTKFVTLPLLALVVGAVRAFGNFDDAMVASTAIMGDLSDAMKNDMSDAAREMGRTTVFSATQAAESYFFLASAGLSAAASIAALPKVAAFAQAGNFDMARATDILTDAQSALGKVMEDPIQNMREMVTLSDILVKANTVANASVEQFGEALTNKAGAAMKQLNIEVETGVAVLAAWADQGVKGAEAGEKFNIVTRDLQTAVRKNGAEFKQFGIEVFDASGGIRNLADIIADLESTLGPMSIEQQGATLALLGFQDRSVQAIRSLIGLSGKIKDYEAGLRSAGGITEDVADKQLESFNKQIGLMKDDLVDIAIELGAGLVPALEDARKSTSGFLQTLRDTVEVFSDYDVETQKTIIKTIAFTAAIGPLLIVFASLTRAVSTLLPILLAIGGPLSLVLATVGFLIIKTFEWQRELNELNGVLNLASGSADRFALAIANALRAKDLADEIDEIKDAVTTLDAELMKINEELSVFAGTDASSNPIFQGLIEEKEGVEAALNDLGDVFHDLRQRQRELVEGTGEANVALEEVVVTAQRVGGAVKLTADQLEALTDFWAQLRADIDPVAEATRNYEAAVVLLDLAIANGITPAEQRVAAVAQLKKEMFAASGGADALTAAMARVSKVDTSESMDFVDQLKAFDDLEKSLKAEILVLEGGEAAWREYAKTMFIANQVAAIQGEATEAQIEKIKELADQLFELRDIDPFKDMFKSVEALGGAMIAFGGIAAGALRDIQGGVEAGTQEYKQLEVAIAAANLVAAIGAVLNQANGDPYTAFARMASMIAAVVALGQSIGNISGFTDTAAERQASQGTGSVLGDAQAKSESILNATEITADATSELVGINRGMLRALQQLNTGLSGASGALARNPQGDMFSAMPKPFDFELDSNFIMVKFGGAILNALFGGKSKITDEGIAILAGSLNDAIDGTLVAAFQEVQSKKFIWSSTKTREEMVALGGEASAQIGLIFQAIGDTVREGALALGISQTLIEERMAAFQIAEQRISLKDLSAEEAQAELAAVFGQIFDDLAGAVVPFIGQFQQVGEGLGETLIRVATSVQVMQEAIKQLGLSVDTTDPEQFAQISVSLIEMTGGIEAFITKFQNFTSKFATDEHKLVVATDALNRAFEQVGLSVPETADGMWALMQTLDATTESGREQIATLLELASVADEYYSLVKDSEKERLKQIQELINQQAVLSAFTGDTVHAGLLQLRDDFKAAVAAADSLGASQREYSMIARAFDNQLKRMAAGLTISVINMTKTLFDGDGLGGVVSDGLQETNTVANSVFKEWQEALESIKDFTESILLDTALTTLTPAQQLAESQRQFDALTAAAMGGDAGAAADLPAAAKSLLENARFMFASGEQFSNIFDATLAALDGVQMPGNIPATVTESTGSTGSGAESPQDAIVSELERYLQALDLAGTLRDLSQVLDTSVIGLAAELKVPLDELVELLGLELGNLSTATASELANVSVALGADVLELATALDISITELAKVFGITIDDFSAEQFKSLVDFSSALGTNLGDLSTVLGIELGRLEDSTSLLSQALDLAIAELPDAIQADLEPLLTDIRTATDAADANKAIGNLGDYVTDLPDGIGDALKPILELMGYDALSGDLDPLSSIERNTADTVAAIHALITTMGGVAPDVSNVADPVTAPITDPYIVPLPPTVPREPVTPIYPYPGRPGNPSLKSTDDVSAQELSQIKTILGDIRDQNRKYQETDITVGRGVESGLRKLSEQERRRSIA